MQAEISLSVILLMACSFRGLQRKTVNVIGNTRSRIHECPNAVSSFKFRPVISSHLWFHSFFFFNLFANQVKYLWKKNNRRALYCKPTASCWKNRTCSTAVRRTCGCKHHVGEPGDTSWRGPRSVPPQTQLKRQATAGYKKKKKKTCLMLLSLNFWVNNFSVDKFPKKNKKLKLLKMMQCIDVRSEPVVL